MVSESVSRRMFFWTLVALFWLVSAVVIGYAFGYRFSPQRGVFIFGGSITLKTSPQNVSVYLNGELMPNGTYSRLNNSYHISGIKPGEYLLEVRAANYKPWTKKISVHSGISTEFWNIILTENSYENESFESQGAQKLFISPHKNIAALAKQNGESFKVDVFDPEDPEMDTVFESTEYSFTKDDKENIEWTPQAHRIIIPAQKGDEKNYFIVSVPSKELLDFKAITGAENISHVRWDPKNKNTLFYMSGNDLYRLNLDSQDKKVVATNIGSYDLSPKSLYYFQLPEGIVYKTSFDAIEKSQQITTSTPDMSDSSYQITVYDVNRITLLNKSHSFYIYNNGDQETYFFRLSDNAFGSQFSDDGKKLLYWTDKEIYTYFTRKWDVQPIRIENEIMPITKMSDRINNVQWARDYEHVLFTNNKKLKMIEIDNRDHRNMEDVLALNSDNPVALSNFTDGKLYYVDADEKGENVLRSFYFPEKTNLLEMILPTSAETEEQIQQ